MRLSARVDYALRAAAELAVGGERPVTAVQLAEAQQIPPKFLENILSQLRRSGLVRSQRGPEGGYWLARPANEIFLADVIRAIDGPLAGVSGVRPETLSFTGSSEPLRDVWVAVRAALRGVLESTTLADVAGRELPQNVRELAADDDAWLPH
jgi:Rrf2 family protein